MLTQLSKRLACWYYWASNRQLTRLISPTLRYGALRLISGKEILQPLAIVVLGGLFTSTALTLLVLPALYGQFGRWIVGQPATTTPTKPVKLIAKC